MQQQTLRLQRTPYWWRGRSVSAITLVSARACYTLLHMVTHCYQAFMLWCVGFMCDQFMSLLPSVLNLLEKREDEEAVTLRYIWQRLSLSWPVLRLKLSPRKRFGGHIGRHAAAANHDPIPTTSPSSLLAAAQPCLLLFHLWIFWCECSLMEVCDSEILFDVHAK